MTRRVTAALVTLACAAAAAACKDIPVLPKWDADWVLPLPSQTISFPTELGAVTVPPTASFPIDFPAQQQAMDGSMGQIFADSGLLRSAQVILELRKNTALATNDTLFVGESQAALVHGNPRTIEISLNMSGADTMVTTTLPITGTNLQMLRSVTDTQGDLWIKLSGRASNPSTTQSVTLTSADQLGIKVRLFATIGVSH